MIIAIKLAKMGYGSPQEILRWDSMDVMVALDYELFLVDYEKEFARLNPPEK